MTGTKRNWMWLAIGLAVAQTAVLTLIGRPLTTPAAPQGIVSFEFAGTLTNAQAIIASWDARTQIVAGLSLGLDFLYPLVYAAAIALSCLAAAPHLPGRLGRFGPVMVGGMAAAAVLDYIENISLIQLLLGSSSALWAPLAWGCAAVKFTLVFLGMGYALVGGTLALKKRAGY
ncbi:MAG: hypothetical protein IAE79_18910 [Anaerolinea sp.]|nr:hypothetical protein [Anaerolinea sp.]